MKKNSWTFLYKEIFRNVIYLADCPFRFPRFTHHSADLSAFLDSALYFLHSAISHFTNNPSYPFSLSGVCPGAVGLKIEIHEIHENLRNPMCIIIKIHPIQQNPLVWSEYYLNPA